MKTNHTPGPWTVNGKTVKSVDHGHHYTVARVDNPKFTPEANAANARLIAAAPDLLAALRALTAVVESYEYGRPWPGRPHAQMDEARAAIARATGA